MILKKVDRYVGRSFLAAFLSTLALLGGLYVTFDLLKRLEDIQEAGLAAAAPTVGTYYAYLFVMFVVDIAPGIVLLASGMVLVGMARRYELLALKACGTSLHRTTAPIFLWTLAISALLFSFRETAGPALARQQELLDGVLRNEVERELLLREPERHRVITVSQYDVAQESMRSVCILEFQPDDPRALARVIQADAAEWAEPGVLALTTVSVRHFGETTEGTPPESRPSLEVRTGLRPFDLVAAAQDEGEALSLTRSLPELLRLMREQPDIPHFRVLFHSRVASFFTPFILLLVGIPCLVGFERSVRSRFLGAVVCIVVAVAFYVVTFVFTSMGETRTLPALAAAWLPAIGGGCAGLWLFQAMVT
jgi:lipopolysaccharide export system permease protein